MEVVITKSKKKDKKYDAVINGKKTLSFGQKGYEDFTIHHDEKRKQNYIKRHSKNENWNDPLTAGFYSRRLLWNMKTLKGSIDDTNKKFKNIHVKLKT